MLLTATLLGVVALSASAATLTVPTTTVLGTDVFSGPTFVVASNYDASDFLSLTAQGTVFLQSGGTFGTNAAGVVVVAGSSPVGDSLANGATTFGSLLLGNGSLGFVQLFPTNAGNGLGSGSPPTTLSLNQTLGSIFGQGLSAGTVLELRISDVNTFDNSGSFVVSSVPEPSTWLFAMSGLGLLAAGRRRIPS
jgi:MYXO-CTERM domain-containing protein